MWCVLLVYFQVSSLRFRGLFSSLACSPSYRPAISAASSPSLSASFDRACASSACACQSTLHIHVRKQHRNHHEDVRPERRINFVTQTMHTYQLAAGLRFVLALFAEWFKFEVVGNSTIEVRGTLFHEKRLSNGSNFTSISNSDYVTSSADNLPRSITCVCFARPFCLGCY